ncbi:MAG: EthD family reductase [Candidatus Velthaea sp.]|jgi:uncharacterized protein (TIGR02118 family)
MSVKITVIFDNPADPATFEKHYAERHKSLAKQIPNVKRVELGKVFPKEDGSPTPAYRTEDLYFDDYTAASAAVATPEGQAYARDALQLGTGGVKFLFSDIE